jgi:hypothetical protein
MLGQSFDFEIHPECRLEGVLGRDLLRELKPHLPKPLVGFSIVQPPEARPPHLALWTVNPQMSGSWGYGRINQDGEFELGRCGICGRTIRTLDGFYFWRETQGDRDTCLWCAGVCGYLISTPTLIVMDPNGSK